MMAMTPAKAAITAVAALAMLGGMAGSSLAQTAKKTPYWAALAKSEALMRVGPSQDYPARWLYQRRDLPVKVVEVYKEWRKVEDPGGTQGWMHVRLLKDDTTAIVKGGVAEMHDGPSAESRLLYKLSANVVGHISGCASGWCAFEVDGHSGYVLERSLWGATEEK